MKINKFYVICIAIFIILLGFNTVFALSDVKISEDTATEYADIPEKIKEGLSAEQIKILKSGKDLYDSLKKEYAENGKFSEQLAKDYEQWKMAAMSYEKAKENVNDNNFFLLLISSIIVVLGICAYYSNFRKSNPNYTNGKKSFFDFNVNAMENNNDLNNFMRDEQNRQFTQWSMEECRKAGTPFDHGGYMQGDGFNPSDTMAADAQRQMDSMNNMNGMF